MLFSGLSTSDIYLPAKDVDPSKWAVVACDQYTSQPEYWEAVKEFVGDSPSTLNLIQPEAFLDQTDSGKTAATMETYLRDGKLVKAVDDGLIITERTTQSGVRIGMIVALDLECYDFTTERLLTRSTAGTIASRLPARVEIRKKACLELPHNMILIDDPQMSVIESARDQVGDKDLVYDFDLMQDGGHLTGWAIQDFSRIGYIASALKALEDKSNGFLYAVGDGNHEIAVAKQCWEEKKKTLTPEEAEDDPARYALVEIVNLHSPAIKFESIHRIVFDSDLMISDDFRWYAKKNGFSLGKDGSSVVFTDGHHKVGFDIKGTRGRIPLAIVQDFLDEWLEKHPQSWIDYIHGDDEVMKLAEGNGTGILLKTISKDGFFDAIRAGGPMPQKTFSMGEANEKRFYMECRRIRN